MSNYVNINEIDDFNKDINRDSEYNILFDSTVDINTLKRLEPNLKQSSYLNIDKELAQSKTNIVINDERKFLHNRKWDYLDKSKIKEIEHKFKLVYEEMNKKQLKILIDNIRRCDLQGLYSDFRPREVIWRIGTLSSLNYLIETTYSSQPDDKDKMFNDKKKLEPYIYKFRNILGDGDCFYRGLIFYFLENIVLTNNIMQMKEILVLYDEKINKKNPIIKKKDYIAKNFENINIGIVSQILYYLINYMETGDISATYIVLLKVFLNCKDFDYGIIYFTRYLLFEYISQNEDKIYSHENQFEIGCLLPEFYCIDKGDKNEYFFENFYSQQLMKPKEFAEKISIYIAPFVFNCNVNVLLYDYGEKSFVQEKRFIGDKIKDLDIYLIFRKAHYDIYYNKKYYDKFSDNLESLPNIMEDICYLNEENQREHEDKIKTENKKGNTVERDNPEKENLGKINSSQNNKSKNEKNNIYQNNYYNYSNYNNSYNDYNNNNNDKHNDKHHNEYNNKNDKYNNLQNCLQCKNSYNHKPNIFNLCDNCLLNEIKSQILSGFLEYLQNEKILKKGSNASSYIQKKLCSISNHNNVSLATIISNSGYQFDELFLEIRKAMCLYCGFGFTEQNYYLELPCQCRICQKKCFLGYLKIIEKKLDIGILDEKSGDIGFMPLECSCGYKYNLPSLFYMLNVIQQKNLNEKQEIYLKFIDAYWKWRCAMCGHSFNKNPNNLFVRLIFKDEKLESKLPKIKSFEHLVCEPCASKYRMKESKYIDCQFCKSKHTKIDIKGVDENNETKSCIIM